MAWWHSVKPEQKGAPVVWIAATRRGVCKVALGRSRAEFVRELERGFPGRGWRNATDAPVLVNAPDQVLAYFRGEQPPFDLPLDIQSGTPFQASVWRAVRGIPFGETRSYQQVAEAVGRPRAMRAVGNAMGLCELSLVIPCHRVIAAGGRIGGWGSDPGIKEWLIEFERTR